MESNSRIDCRVQSAPNVTLSPPSRNSTSHPTSERKRKCRTRKKLSPADYGKAVFGYSRLSTGAGQNHTALGGFLTTNEDEGPKIIPVKGSDDGFESEEPEIWSYVTLYPLTIPGRHGQILENDSSDDRCQLPPTKERERRDFSVPDDLYHFEPASSYNRQSRIVFLRGFMSAPWLNSIGARYFVDPEYFCRHLDFIPKNDSSANFSIPALPSSSWHLIELPVMTIGTFKTSTTIEQLRQDGIAALNSHHRTISKLSMSGMRVGESMIRDFHVFDDSHYAIEQRISICMQEACSAEQDDPFTLLVWLDSGRDFDKNAQALWTNPGSEGRLLPVIRHKHMVALKCHLFSDQAGAKQVQSASSLHNDYGRSLHPTTMAKDAFYSLNEIFSFSASSEMQFLNLLDAKLDRYTEPSVHESDSLPNLKYAKEILYRHIQKIQQVLDSIHNTEHPKWPKAKPEDGVKKAKVASDGLNQDFEHLLNRAEMLHRRCNESITVLLSSVSISESKKAIEQARRVGKLTFLAFIFVPLSFTTSFFGMNVKELGPSTSLWWWAVFSMPVFAIALSFFFLDIFRPFKIVLRYCKTCMRS